MENKQEHEEYLRYLTYKGLKERFGEWQNTPQRERVDHELSIINEAGYPSYFLIIHDLIKYCKDNNIPVGPGRGSVCGSMVAYCLGITEVDPIRFNIPFERFLHLERIAMPDIDLDLCMDRREDAIEYLRQKYGEDSLAQIITFGTMRAKAVIRDVCRVLNVDKHILGKSDRSNELGDDLASMLPEGQGADRITLEEFMDMEEGKEFKEKVEQIEVPYKDRKIKLVEQAKKLEGLRRHSSSHAAGVVISDGPIIESAPLYRRNQQSEVQTQYDYRDAESIGLLKIDVLGLRTVTAIGEAEKLIRENKDSDFKISDVPLDDQETFDLLEKGDTVGVFQVEGEGITNVLKGIKPDRFEDIIATIALYRPGPMEQLGSYIDRKHGREEVTYIHEDLKPILENTYGLLVYQEQVIEMAKIMGGYSPGEADVFRKAIGKKIPELIEKQIKEFKERALDRGYDEQLINDLCDSLKSWARYAFNRGHSTGYGLITYWTAYLKAHYPTEFFTATLNSYLGDLDRISTILIDADNHDIEILCPDINESHRGFTMVDDSHIRFGLEAVKGVGDSMIKDIIEERDSEEKNYYTTERVTRTKDDGTEYKANIRVTKRVENTPEPFDGPWDFCNRLTHIPINAKKALCISGAFSDDIEYRKVLYEAFDDLNKAAKKEKGFNLSEWSGPTMSEIELMRLENETMGFYVTTHPLDYFEDHLSLYQAEVEGDFSDMGSKSTIAGIVKNINTHMSKRGEMAWVSLENDIEDLPDVTMFNNTWSNFKNKVKKDDIIIVDVRKKYHPKYEWNIIAEKARVLDRSRPDADSILIGMVNPDIGEIAQIKQYTDNKGAKVYLAIESNERVGLLATRLKIDLDGATIRKLQQDGYIVRLDVKGKNSPYILWKGEKLQHSKNTYKDKGKGRVPIWELQPIQMSMDLLEAKVISELE